MKKFINAFGLYKALKQSFHKEMTVGKLQYYFVYIVDIGKYESFELSKRDLIMIDKKRFEIIC
jgi:hypothetical protein